MLRIKTKQKKGTEREMMKRQSGRSSEEGTLSKELNEAKIHSKAAPCLRFKNG